MAVSRREFIRNGVGAFTIGLAAPAFLTDLAQAQSASSRSLVVLYFGGGNDALSTLIPYTDPYYYSRRASIAVPAASVLQIGSDTGRTALGLHTNLTGIRDIFSQGHLAIIQRTGYENSSRSHFTGQDIWGSANPINPYSLGWLGRYLDTLPSPVNPLVAWDALREIPRALVGEKVSVPAIASAATYTYTSPNTGAEAALERSIAQRISSHVPVDRPHLAYVNGTIDATMNTLDKAALVAAYKPTITYPTTGLGQTLLNVAGAISKGVGTKVFWVQLGGFDTHASQAGTSGSYPRLMTELNDAVTAFYNDLKAQGLMDSTMLVTFSEFGRRVYDNGSGGCDHGAAGVMLALGGAVRGGLYGTAASLNPDPQNPTLENNGGDVRYETDFRSVYARILDQWLGANSVALLGSDFRKPTLSFI
jgi:uncharacterized protein (DUF1501 family)